MQNSFFVGPPPIIIIVPVLSIHGINTTEDFVEKVTFFILSSDNKYEGKLPIRNRDSNILDKFLMLITFLMKIALIVAPVLLLSDINTSSKARLSTIFEPKEKETDKYKALCSNGGIFDGCTVFLKNNKLNSISINGVSEFNLCNEEAEIGFRSNPSSPYKKVSVMNLKLEEVTKKERGIDHDFLFSIPKENSYGKNREIVRFKNPKVAQDFARSIDVISSTCGNK